MKRVITKSQYLFTSGVVGCLILLNIACDSNSVSDEVVSMRSSELATELSSDLNLSTADVEALEAVIARHDDSQPGYLWHVAADLQSSLSEEQMASFFSSVDQSRSEMRSRYSEMNKEGQTGLRGPKNRGDATSLLTSLSEEQKLKLNELREKHRAQFADLRKSEDGSAMPRTERRERMETHRQAVQREVESILTNDQLEELEAKRTEMRDRFVENAGDRRASVRTNYQENWEVMVEALQLTAEQQSAISTLRSEQAERRQEMIQQRQSGNVSDSTPRRRAGNPERETMLTDLLTEDQLEVMKIYRSLVGIGHLQNTELATRGKRMRFRNVMPENSQR